ncbi:hypothetical protein [Corallococcus macrosporus]|uniref:Uncharacterized protein n=1 Tax=Corallococcus macrosporus DSM 14697 TaxID=1189310 RepID=A0A250JRZ4_9BACT|nr:hypothetical protein [Corallococcus macrosporus]ATB45906.1 hypothetical protein MYMAC_001494 [Corallococcus macrosporus DSM 14697]
MSTNDSPVDPQPSSSDCIKSESPTTAQELVLDATPERPAVADAHGASQASGVPSPLWLDNEGADYEAALKEVLSPLVMEVYPIMVGMAELARRAAPIVVEAVRRVVVWAQPVLEEVGHQWKFSIAPAVLDLSPMLEGVACAARNIPDWVWNLVELTRRENWEVFARCAFVEYSLHGTEMALVQQFTTKTLRLNPRAAHLVAEALIKSNWPNASDPIAYLRGTVFKLRQREKALDITGGRKGGYVFLRKDWSEDPVLHLDQQDGDPRNAQQLSRFETLDGVAKVNLDREARTLLLARLDSASETEAARENGWDSRHLERVRKRLQRNLPGVRAPLMGDEGDDN